MAQEKIRIPNLDTLADYIDRLIVEVNKLAWFENQKRREQAQAPKNVVLIAELDDRSRDCCELRSLLKTRINSLFEEILTSKEYHALREVRTFRPPRRVSDVLADRCHDIGDIALRGELVKALTKEMTG